MKRLIICIILASFFLSSCVINRVSVYKLRGDRIGFPVGGVIPVSGDDVKGILVHWFYYTDEKNRELPQVPIINIIEKAEEDSIDVTR